MIFVFLAVFFLSVSLLLFSIIKGAPFATSRPETIKRMVSLSRVKRGERVADLGAGDGRILIAFAKAGGKAYGYEINPLLVLLARHRIKKARLERQAFVYWKNFWKVNYSSFDIIVLFGISSIMPPLEKKLGSELKIGARIISNAFAFPFWNYERKEDELYLYKKTAS